MNAATPQVSVLLPVFNGEQFLAMAIESVLAQTFADFELVIIDDGSTDGTAAVIDRYRTDPRLQPHRLPVNQGLVAGLNFGLTQCRGDLVARLDADDTCKPTRLAIQVAAFTQDTSLVLHATAYDGYSNSGELVHSGCPPLTHASLVGAMVTGNRLRHSTVMFRRDVASRIGAYKSEWFPVEDYDLWLRLCVAGRFTGSSRSEVRCISNPGGISNSQATVQAHLHRERYFAEISRLAGRPVNSSSSELTTARTLAIGRRHQSRLLKARGISADGLSAATYAAALRLLSHRNRLSRRVIVFTAAPLLPALAFWDRHRPQRD